MSLQPSDTVSRPRFDLLVRTALTAAIIGGFYALRGALVQAFAGTLDPATIRVAATIVVLASLLGVWWPKVRRDARFHAPFLITVILALSDASFGILENHPAPPWLAALTGGWVLEYSPTFVTMAITVLTELAVGRLVWGQWPHLASAYISGISVGILMKSSAFWPFALCGMVSILSKYVLRAGDRHLWNPTNFGMTALLFLAPQHVASLSVQAGNNGWAVAVIWMLGGLIMYKLKRFHIPMAFIAAFVPLAFVRSLVTDHPWQTELAPLTSPMFQLYIFFMITDPKTTVRGRRNQMIVAVLVAVAETALRLAFKDVHSLYHALFIVGPAATVVEIVVTRARAKDQPATGMRVPAAVDSSPVAS
ncbi:RnfABCDGE type electron transport complex subunit D [Limnoglobus roseus]|uniref:Electron transport complex subunit RsxD n=1 Tax=Limnoglobus roseus TaxID=2598579 RepID=A0A5C1A6A7_9BACT|nr:RnfABCDGE type electron transport complex subunit D [Limnoglobus roseus]QEL13526.1 Electron transport complex subunit RsxD [Limnoglobus roseus]